MRARGGMQRQQQAGGGSVSSGGAGGVWLVGVTCGNPTSNPYSKCELILRAHSTFRHWRNDYSHLPAEIRRQAPSGASPRVTYQADDNKSLHENVCTAILK